MPDSNHSVSRLFESYPKRKVTKGTIVIYQGEVPQSAYVIIEGIVKVYSISAQGEERIVNFLSSEEIFPTAWVFDRASSSTFYYEAQNDCRVYQISRVELIERIRKSPEAQQLALDQYVASYTGALARIAA